MMCWQLAWAQMAQPSSRRPRFGGAAGVGDTGFLGSINYLRTCRLGCGLLSPDSWRHHPVACKSHTALQNNDISAPLCTQRWKAPWLTSGASAWTAGAAAMKRYHMVRSSDSTDVADVAHELFQLQQEPPNVMGEAHLINKMSCRDQDKHLLNDHT